MSQGLLFYHLQTTGDNEWWFICHFSQQFPQSQKFMQQSIWLIVIWANAIYETLRIGRKMGERRENDIKIGGRVSRSWTFAFIILPSESVWTDANQFVVSWSALHVVWACDVFTDWITPWCITRALTTIICKSYSPNLKHIHTAISQLFTWMETRQLFLKSDKIESPEKKKCFISHCVLTGKNSPSSPDGCGHPHSGSGMHSPVARSITWSGAQKHPMLQDSSQVGSGFVHDAGQAEPQSWNVLPAPHVRSEVISC